jgi:dihydrolipoamide dehydrogenase
MSEKTFDVVVIGGGPGGYVCSIKCAQLGLKVACIEKRNFLGGTCLNEGCIPSKTLLNSSYLYYQAKKDFKKLGINFGDLSINLDDMMKNKSDVIKDLANGINFLFKKNNITHFKGVAKISSVNDKIKEVTINDTEKIQTKNIVIATGSESAIIPGIDLDEKVILSSQGALDLQVVPETMIVVGAGAIGLEMASVWSRLGAKVSVIEYMDRIAPTMDNEISAYFLKSLINQGIEFYLSSKIKNIDKSDDGSSITATFEVQQQEKKLSAEKILIAIGRKPYIGDLGVELDKNQRGFIKVDENFQTTIPGVYAIGDVIPGPMLAHKAEEEAVALAEILSGRKSHIGWIPSVIYTHPEVASIGKTEEEIKNLGIKYKVSKFPFAANSRARANNDTEGFIKMIVDEFDTILGVHIIGPSAATIIAEAVLAMEYGASAEDIARTCHSHPDLNEALKEAALGAFFKPIHS